MNDIQDGNGWVDATGTILLDRVLERIKLEARRDADAAIADKEQNAIIAAEVVDAGTGISFPETLRPKFTEHEKEQIRTHYCAIRIARLGDELLRLSRGKDRLVE